MTKMPIKISIITATFNAENQLAGLIDSLRQQTDRDFAWIVVDGASTDGTMQLVREASDIVTQSLSEEDFGIYHALNKGIKLATGDYYLVMGADDRLAPEAVALYRQKALETNADLVTGFLRVGKHILKPRGNNLSWRHDIWQVVSGHSVGCLIRKSLHDAYGYYSRRFPICADSEFLLKVYRSGGLIATIPEIVGEFSETGTSGRDWWGVLTENFRVRLEYGNPLFSEMLLVLLKMLKSGKKGFLLANKKKVRLL